MKKTRSTGSSVALPVFKTLLTWHFDLRHGSGSPTEKLPEVGEQPPDHCSRGRVGPRGCDEQY